MGLRNSLATHQQHVTLALKEYIGNICHVYLDDIIIWLSSLAEHQTNVTLILEALWKSELYCSTKMLMLFTTEIDFLGHHISVWGIEADTSKVACILNWLAPQSAKHIWQFLGLVQYIAAFLPTLAEHTAVLTPLTRKEFNTVLPLWTTEHQQAFDAIKQLVVSWDCLTTINYETPGENKIFITCDASKCRTGAVLAFGLTWETAWPVAFKSWQLNTAQHNYPVHEQEMLAIMWALKK